MKILCAVDSNWKIGSAGRLLFHIPDDLKRFRRLTEGNTIIMGRKTLESLPGSKALANRRNIVLTRDRTRCQESIDFLFTREELLLELENAEGEFFLIGGGELIEGLIDLVDEAYITKIYAEGKDADVGIPNLDEDEGWTLLEESQLKRYKDIEYRYCRYRRN